MSRSLAEMSPVIRGFETRALLPPTIAPLIGRAQLVSSIASLLQDSTHRLVTLTGPGGVGKSCLAVHSAKHHLRIPQDRTVFISLANVLHPAQVISTIAACLGLHEGNRQLLSERLCSALGGGPVLLVLDNFEQVATAAPELLPVFDACPELTVLATSRIPLRIIGEHVIVVPPLTLPPSDDEREIAKSEAVALFLARAEALQPGVSKQESLLPMVAEICRALDGLPLAIELAAARVGLFSVPVLLDRLSHPLSVLTNGPTHLPQRLQTMSDAIAWSYDLLTPSAQSLFRQLSVFVGGFSLESALIIADRPEAELLSDLETLIAHGLVRASSSLVREPYYQMLQVIRDYGCLQLKNTGDDIDTRHRHAHVMIELTERADRLVDAANPLALRLLDVIRPDVLSALNWLQQCHDADRALRLTSSMWRYWRVRGFLTEGLERFLAALALTDVPSAIVAEALWKTGYLAFFLGEPRAAQAHLESSVTLYEQLEDSTGLASAADALGTVQRSLGFPVLAEQLHQRALDMRRQCGDTFGQALPLANLGMLALDRGDLEQARIYFDQALDLSIAHGSIRDVAYRLVNRASLLFRSGDWKHARAVAEEALATFESIGDFVGEMSTCELLGRIASQAVMDHESGIWYLRSIRLRLKYGMYREVADVVERIAVILIWTAPDIAAQLLGASEEYRRTSALPRITGDVLSLSQARKKVVTMIGEATFGRYHLRGRTLTMTKAARLAESHLAARQPLRPARLSPSGDSQGFESTAVHKLTGRELEVLQLMAAGHTNRAIAASLFISPATVKRHVTNILSKLGLSTRAAAISLAFQQGLVVS